MVDAREYHERTNHSPRSVRDSSYQPDPATQPRPYKQYDDVPTVQAPADFSTVETPALTAVAQARADGSPVGVPGASSDPPIHTLCHYATGVTKVVDRRGRSVRFRAAACTGKLYHVDLYLVTGDCGPAGPGVYHFDPHEESYDLLREGDYRGVLDRATGGDTAVGAAPVTVVATSTWWRNAWKYRNRTYRHAFWDAGTILANLLAVAHGTGHRAQVVAGFADATVVDLLGVDPEHEAPLALVAVGEHDPINAPPATVEPIDSAVVPNTTPDADFPLVPDAWGQSTLADGDAATAWRERVRSHEGIETRDLGDTERVVLDPVDEERAVPRPLTETIDRRGSLREYDREPMSKRMAATVLDRALRGVPSACASGQRCRAPGHLVSCYPLVLGVEGVPTGAYRYDPTTGVLERVGETDRETAGHLALDQPVVGDAALSAYLTADVESVVETLGNRGYRLAMLEAGICLGRLYLATYAHLALGGRGFTFYDDRVADHLTPTHATGNGGDVSPMTLFAAGRPTPERRS